MNQMDWLTLAFTTFAIAMTLIVEHFITERGLKFPPQGNYALGLLTDMGGVLIWAAIRGKTLTPDVAVAMMCAACIAGIPEFILLTREQRAERRAWRALVRQNQDQAARLALMKQLNGRGYRQFRDFREGMTFALGAAQIEMETLKVFQDQLEPLLRPFIEEAEQATAEE